MREPTSPESSACAEALALPGVGGSGDAAGLPAGAPPSASTGELDAQPIKAQTV
jgi:hypothetical protein